MRRTPPESPPAVYDIAEVDILRCIVKSEGRKEVRVQAFFALKKDSSIKGRKQRSFSISKFGLDGAWSRANRCKEFIEQVGRFPIDDSEIDSYYVLERAPARRGCELQPFPDAGSYLPCPLPGEPAALRALPARLGGGGPPAAPSISGSELLATYPEIFERTLAFVSDAATLATCELVCRRLRRLISEGPYWAAVFRHALPHVVAAAALPAAAEGDATPRTADATPRGVIKDKATAPWWVALGAAASFHKQLLIYDAAVRHYLIAVESEGDAAATAAVRRCVASLRAFAAPDDRLGFLDRLHQLGF